MEGFCSNSQVSIHIWAILQHGMLAASALLVRPLSALCLVQAHAVRSGGPAPVLVLQCLYSQLCSNGDYTARQAWSLAVQPAL